MTEIKKKWEKLLYRLFGIPPIKNNSLRPHRKVHTTFINKLPYNEWVVYIKKQL